MDFKTTNNSIYKNLKNFLITKWINHKNIINCILITVFIYPLIIYLLNIYCQLFIDKGFVFTFISVVTFILDLFMVIHTCNLINKAFNIKF